MDELKSITPRCGDVIFTATKGLERWASVSVQAKVDPLAAKSPRFFTHVALAVNDFMALEAVPKPTEPDGVIDKALSKWTAGVCDPLRTCWSNIELDFGVRPIPIQDIVVGSLKEGGNLSVLRSTADVSAAEKLLDLTTREILGQMGSAYDLDPLHKSMETALSKAQLALVRAAPIWAAPAADLNTLIGLSAEQRAQLDRWAPGALPDYETRSFFCSQLVPHLLRHAGLLRPGATAANITPSGLYQALLELSWRDVSDADFSPEAARQLLHNSAAASTCGSHFMFWRAHIAQRREMLGLGATGSAIGGALSEMNEMLRNIQEKLNRWK